MDFRVLGQPGLQSEFQDSQDCTEKPCLEKQTNKQTDRQTNKTNEEEEEKKKKRHFYAT